MLKGRWRWGVAVAGVVALAMTGWKLGGKVFTTTEPVRGQAIAGAAQSSALGRVIVSAGGRHLTSTQVVPAFLIRTQEIPGAAVAVIRSDLRWPVRQPLPKQLLVSRGSTLYHVSKGWGPSVVQSVRMQVMTAQSHVSQHLLAVMEATSRHPLPTWHLVKGEWQVSKPAPLVSTIRWRFSRQLAKGLAPGASAVVFNRRGQILAWASVPAGRGVGWQPFPLHLLLLPPLLAEAATNGPLWSGVSKRPVGQELAALSAQWQPHALRKALEQLGIGQTPLATPSLTVPALPTIKATTLTAGTGLWANTLEVGRAFIPLIAHGQLPTLSLLQHRVASTPLLAGHWNTVGSLLPQITAAGVSFSIWKPSSNDLVIWSSQGPGMVMVLHGTAHLPTLLSAAAHNI